MQDKLRLAGPQSLISDYRAFGAGRAQELIGDVLDLGGRILAKDPGQLAVQMLARLAPQDAEGMDAFLAAASACLPCSGSGVLAADVHGPRRRGAPLRGPWRDRHRARGARCRSFRLVLARQDAAAMGRGERSRAASLRWSRGAGVLPRKARSPSGPLRLCRQDDPSLGRRDGAGAAPLRRPRGWSDLPCAVRRLRAVRFRGQDAAALGPRHRAGAAPDRACG